MNSRIIPLSVFIVVGITSSGQVNNEALIDWDMDKSARSASIYEISSESYRIGCGMLEYESNDSGKTPHHGQSLDVTHYVEIDKLEFAVDSIDSSEVPNYNHALRISEDNYVIVTVFDTTEEDTSTGDLFRNNGFGFGGIDFGTSSVYYKKEGLLNVMGIHDTRIENGDLYVFYDIDGGARLEQRSTVDFSLFSGHDINDPVHNQTFNPTNSEYIFITAGSSAKKKNLHSIDLNGNVTLLKTDLEMEDHLPGLFSIDTLLFEFAFIPEPSPHYMINSYGLSGVALESESIDQSMYDVYDYDNHIIVITYNDSDSVSTPVGIRVYSYDLNEVFADDYGYESVVIWDTELEGDELLIVGTTTKHYGYQGTSSKDKLYLLSLDLSQMVGESELDGESFTLYPNPAKKKTIILESSTIDLIQIEDSSIKIVDLSGKELSARVEIKGSNQIELDVSNLDKGIHILYIQTASGQIASRKFVVE